MQKKYMGRTRVPSSPALALAPRRPDEPIDFTTLSARADLAYATSLNVERRLNDLMDLLGANRNTLDMRQFAVVELDRAVSTALLEVDPSIEEIRRWAGVFFAVDEAYLLLVKKYVGTEEPWKKLMDLGYKLAVDAPYERFDAKPELRVAYAYLRAARTQLRTVAYFYCRETHGKDLTEQVFGKKSNVTTRIMGLLYPH